MNRMNEEAISEILNEISLDLRAEVVVADLVRKGLDPNDVLVKPIGLFRRKFSKDIAGVESVEFGNSKPITVLKIHREGLYDVLPQSLFHFASKKPRAFKNVSTMVEETRQRLEEEARARAYFFAFELEFFKHRLTIEFQEQKLLETISYTMDDEKMLLYWDLPNFMDQRQRGILFYLLPIVHKIRGSIHLMEEAYSTILKTPIKIVKDTFGHPGKKAGLKMNVLGRMDLSVNSVIGDRDYDIFDCLRIEVGPVKAAAVYEYLPGGIGRKVLDHLNSLFLPVTIENKIQILTEKSQWRLNSDNRNESRLGYSVYA
ncbi:MAG TPA: type VI secretion system baseplate subunit TssG [Bacteroidia bacterium]|nr:type VI secretion system baseplate subunit TssG [Bacteroidia bacterium]